MIQALIIIHMVAAIAMVTCILLQQGRGATAGAGFGGSSASGTVFGAKGSANFLSRTTAILATTFFATSLALSVMGGRSAQPEKDLLDDVDVPAIEQDIPAAQESDVPTATIPDAAQQAIPEDLPEQVQPPVTTE
ncbi:MAG: preprotein translocase subunit SecG [Gammaproteobacteria bacterium]|nr:preprotein translocase subunit SecG [Gammaproteobacteria bacterium]